MKAINPHKNRLFIAGADEIPNFQSHRLTHVLRVANPASPTSKPAWLRGPHLQLSFGDVTSEADARRCRTKAPTKADLLEALTFFRKAWLEPESRILVACDYGASRSPALAYVLLADQLGPGQEAEAFRIVMQIRPDAVPNALVVRLGDLLLERGGALLAPLQKLHRKIDEELSS